MRRWQGLTGLYVGAALGFYLVTWYVWGGFEDKGHPPLWDVEEFFAASGLKFMVYFAVSVVLYHTTKRIRIFPEWVIVLLSGKLFLVMTTLVENWLLSQIGWAHFFGGRSIALGYLIAVLFFALQTMLFYYTRLREVWDFPKVETSMEPGPPACGVIVTCGSGNPKPLWFGYT